MCKIVIFLFVYITALFGTLVLLLVIPAYLLLAAWDRPRRRSLPVPLAMLCGYIGGGLLIWGLVPRTWSLSLWTTFAASVNAEKYGHPVEHYAEMVVIWILFGAVVGAVAGGGVAWLLKRRPRLAPRHSL